jgi:hypothetical protein
VKLEHGGDLLNITNENSRYKGGIVEVVKGTKLNTITNFKGGTIKVGVDCGHSFTTLYKKHQPYQWNQGTQ